MTSSAVAYGASTVKRDRWSNARLAELDDAIITAVRADYPTTLRSAYYRVTSAGAVDKTEAGYRRVQRQLLKLRRAGTIPQSWITDGTRWVTKPTTWPSMEAKLRYEQQHYRRALWHDTPHEVQIFTEKDAISGTILPVTETYDVPLGVLRGYCSEPFAYSVAMSIIESNLGRSGNTYLYQLGDHDPSGIDAWRAFTERVVEFIGDEADEVLDYLYFERLAVTEGQILELGLPTRPTKRSDTRSRGFGGRSVEVDAIPAPTLRTIVEEAITQHVDPHHHAVLGAVEAQERDGFRRMAEVFAGGAA